MNSRRQFLRYSVALGMLGWKNISLAEDSALRLGTLPVISARTAYEVYQPLIKYLETELKQPIYLETPANFKGMYRRILENGFDLLISPPHIARLAQKKLGWQPLVMCQPGHHAELLAMEETGPKTIEELRGSTIAVLDNSALVVMIMMEALAKKGLLKERDFKVIETRSYESSQLAVKQGIAQAMVARSQGFLAKGEREHMRAIFQAGALPGYVLIVAPSIPQKQARLLQKKLLDFSAMPDARMFMEKLGYESFTAVTELSLKELDSYLDATEVNLR